MNPEIKYLSEKKLVGKRINMSLAQNKTPELWRSFMPRRKEIKDALNTHLISMSVYDPSYSFTDFNPTSTFDKWAALEVRDLSSVPEDMESFILPEGEYAVFFYKGRSSDPSIFYHIFGSWLPGSEYVLDKRPHFELLGEKYKNDDPDSEEEIWIPVKRKSS